MSFDVERLLREGMEQHRNEKLQLPPDLTVRVGRVRRRRRTFRLILTTAPVVAAVGALVAIGLGEPQSNAPPQTGRKNELPLRTAAYVVHAVERAVSHKGRLIQVAYTVSLGSSGEPEHGYELTWISGEESAGRRLAGNGVLRRVDVWGGRTHMEYGVSWRGVALTQTAVNYDTRTWDRSSEPYVSSIYSARSCRSAGPADYRAFIRWGLRCGNFVVSGRATIDGVQTIKIVNVPGIWAPSLVFWVDQRTFLPVRFVFDTRHTSYPAVFRVDEQTDFRWLPPTKANLGNLAVRIPAGFGLDPNQPLTNACGFLPCN